MPRNPARSRMNIRRHPLDPKLRRMYAHIYNGLRREGLSDADALRIAAATVNKHRAEHGLTIAEHGRRGWWPGKEPRRRRSQ